MEKTYESITELVQDSQFVDEVTRSINKIRESRLKRPDPKPGYRYKRDWYDRMRDDGQFNTNFFLSNIEAVWNHKSNLPSIIRRVIEDTCNRALHLTFQYYHEIPEPVQEVIESKLVPGQNESDISRNLDNIPLEQEIEKEANP